MQAKDIPLQEIRKLIAEELKIPDDHRIDVFWDSHFGLHRYNYFGTDGAFMPDAQGRVENDGDLKIVQERNVINPET